MTDILKLFGKKVRAIRKAQGLSQESLAEMADLHNTYIGGVERGERNLSLKSIEKIAHALKTSMKVFFESAGNDFVVSEDLESSSYGSSKEKPPYPLEQEMQKCISSLKDDELRASIISMIRLISKMR